MKISLTKFYHEVTGSKTGNSTVTEPAMKRWGVPVDPIDPVTKTKDRVDTKYLDIAREAYKQEQEEAVVRKQARELYKPKFPKSAKPSTQKELFKPMKERDTSPYRGIMDKLQAQSEALGRVEGLLNRIVNDLGIKT